MPKHVKRATDQVWTARNVSKEDVGRRWSMRPQRGINFPAISSTISLSLFLYPVLSKEFSFAWASGGVGLKPGSPPVPDKVCRGVMVPNTSQVEHILTPYSAPIKVNAGSTISSVSTQTNDALQLAIINYRSNLIVSGFVLNR
ncbi:hypothetical protein RUM43_003099 [Polyplax serrata]|uniref:Uncharacterized protein n=1 Tax=Polyplax serrata TaxID=468196 RepID=A0AAN8PEV9_POLSC